MPELYSFEARPDGHEAAVSTPYRRCARGWHPEPGASSYLHRLVRNVRKIAVVSCGSAKEIPKSTLSQRFKALREAGLIAVSVEVSKRETLLAALNW